MASGGSRLHRLNPETRTGVVHPLSRLRIEPRQVDDRRIALGEKRAREERAQHVPAVLGYLPNSGGD